MRNLIAFLTKYFHWIVFILLELISVILLFRYNSYQGSVWISSANAVTGKVNEWISSVEQFFSLQERSWQLEQRNMELESKYWNARQELLALRGDTAAVDSSMVQAINGLELLPAKVVNNTLDRHDNLITINRGSSDGVEPDMGVVCGMGLVGVVYMVSSGYAVVLPVLNSHSRISCAIRDTGYFGYLIWDGGNSAEAFMEDVPRHAQLEKGSWVETSGYSNIFPPGISVGQIMDIGNSVDGLSYRLKIKLSTDFGCLRDVFVIKDKDFAERNKLLMSARDSISLAH